MPYAQCWGPCNVRGPDFTLVLLYRGSYCITIIYISCEFSSPATHSTCLRLTPFKVDGIFPSVFGLTSPHGRKWNILSPWSKVKVQ